VSLVLSGVASIVAIVLLFLPESRVYFRAVGDLRRAEFAAKHGATPPPARGSLGGLFRPRPPAPATSRETGVSLDKHAEAAGRPRAAKAKSRTEAEAIARGAQLARERAKASKSRRTEPS
jgi:hypothetical protein